MPDTSHAYEVRCPRGHFLALVRINLPTFAGIPVGAARGYCKACATKFDQSVTPRRGPVVVDTAPERAAP